MQKKLLQKMISVLIAFLVVAVSIAVGSSSASADDGIQSRVLSSVSQLPRDSFVYPVRSYSRTYYEDAATPQRLSRGVRTSLFGERANSSQNSVTNTTQWNVGGTITVGWTPNNGGLNGSIAVTGSYTSTYAVNQVTNVSFSGGQNISLMSRVDNMVATPVYFKDQFQADYYRTDRSGNAVRLTWDRPLQGDVVRYMGWNLECGNRACVAGQDYTS